MQVEEKKEKAPKAATAVKAEKHEAKTEKKTAHAESTAQAKPSAEAKKEKKPRIVVALKRPIKSEKAKKMHALLQKRKCLPTFRGKFGCENIRRHNIEKFSKWRKVRGIDTKRKKENGATPSTGYGFNAETRHFHPSGYSEMIVANPSQLQKFPKDTAARISSTVGRKKRMDIVRKANELGIHVLNY